MSEYTEKIEMFKKDLDSGYGYEESLFLGTAAIIGSLAPTKIAKESGLSLARCKQLEGMARQTGLFKGRRIHHSGWFGKKNGGAAFTLDVGLLMGLFERERPAQPKDGKVREDMRAPFDSFIVKSTWTNKIMVRIAKDTWPDGWASDKLVADSVRFVDEAIREKIEREAEAAKREGEE